MQHALVATRRGRRSTGQDGSTLATTLETRPAAHGEPLLYVYGILEAGTGAHRLLRTGSIAGLDPAEPLFPIEQAELVAAVSRVPSETFAEEPLNQLLTDLPLLAPFAVRHGEAVRALLEASPALIPMAFGALFHGTAGIRQLLEQRERVFCDLLERVRGRREWGLKVLGDRERLQRAAEAGSTLRELAREIEVASSGRAYLLRKRRERLVAAATQRLAAEGVGTVVERLAAASIASRREELPSGAALLAKAAFLVDVSASDSFVVLARELHERFSAQGLTLEVTGPWAPYSFVGEANARA
ncbi:MAG: GvpL/GvpF family gas vesicle protein [Chloroflexi bacterium]|nr:GvpL/GvpF family gas vesicle protein [Chloroflexota bacterium]